VTKSRSRDFLVSDRNQDEFNAGNMINLIGTSLIHCSHRALWVRSDATARS